jgi:hypothetical protein
MNTPSYEMHAQPPFRCIIWNRVILAKNCAGHKCVLHYVQQRLREKKIVAKNMQGLKFEILSERRTGLEAKVSFIFYFRAYSKL